MNAPVVVAYDQTPHSKRALAEAVREAVARGTGLRIVHAYTLTDRLPTGPFATVTPAGNVEQTNRRDAEEVLAETAAKVRAESPELTVETLAVPGDPSAAIVSAAADAELLVVGSRGRGGFAGLLLGSTSQRILAGSPCPVVVVQDTPAEYSGRILVGLDIDEPCDTVLDFAFDTAARRGAGLIAATVWIEPWTMAYAARLGDEDGTAYEKARADRLNQVLEPWRGKHPDVAVVSRLYAGVASGTAGTCLVEASKEVDLLIVGARSEAGRRHVNRLGPVSHTVLHHAHCPVAVVPHQEGS